MAFFLNSQKFQGRNAESHTCSVVLRWLFLGPFIAKSVTCHLTFSAGEFQLFTLVHHTLHASETLLDRL